MLFSTVFLEIPAKGFLPSFPMRCFLLGTQLPYDSNPVALGYKEQHTFFSTCARLEGIGFESRPTVSPPSSQSSLHAMNNKWHQKKNQVEIEREYKANSSNVEEEGKKKYEGSFKPLWLRVIIREKLLIAALMHVNIKTRDTILTKSAVTDVIKLTIIFFRCQRRRIRLVIATRRVETLHYSKISYQNFFFIITKII